MLDSRPARALALQVGLLVWGGRLVGTVDSRGLPTEYSLAAAPDRYAGEEVVVTAEVVSTDPLVVADSFQYRDVRVTVVDADVDAAVGDDLRVYGVVESTRDTGTGTEATVRALNAFVVPRSGLQYAYVVSALAGLWVLYRLVRGWRLDTGRWGLIPREEDSRGEHHEREGGEPTDA
jgi:hypothetical protein